MTINSNRLYQLFKYTVYALLTLNIFFFYFEESVAAPLQFPGGISFGNFSEAYAATLDTLAWVILLLMFELETWVLEDQQFTRKVRLSLHGLRAICYTAILFAFTNYDTIRRIELSSGLSVVTSMPGSTRVLQATPILLPLTSITHSRHTPTELRSG